MELKILTCNINGLDDKLKHRKYFGYIRQESINITFVQETHSERKIEKIWRNECCGVFKYSHITSKSCGVAILFKKGLDVEIVKIESDSQGRMLKMRINFREH